ncbi:MAG: TonB-dependent receptor [Pseudomonadota bacterium]
MTQLKVAREGRARRWQRRLLLTSAVAPLAVGLGAVTTASSAAQDADVDDEIVVQGIRQSLADALNEKRNASNLVEVIQAVDIGKLPDQNLAEVLENLPGIQITRTAGVGTGVQIRGTNANRTEINGVSTVASGTGRTGISFEDVNAAIIAAVEVIKAPEAKTIEGSVGGTINLRTIRPLDLDGPLIVLRGQGEYSDLSESVKPRFAGSFGNNWDTDAGQFGIVISGSYTQQEATSFRPRVDRDNLVENVNADVIRNGNLEDQPTQRPAAQGFDFLPIQFLNQELENFEFETLNIAGTAQWAPNENIMFYFDTVINDQERRQDSSRVQGSGVSSVRNFNVPDAFETVNFGVIDGVDLGSIEAASRGTINPIPSVDDDDPNLRFSSDTGARVTDSRIFSLGTEFNVGRLSARIEGSLSSSDTVNPNLSTTLNFINPNPLTPPDGTSNDNSVPFAYDFTGGALTFGVAFDSPFAPTVEDLLNPNNVVLDAVTVGRNSTENSENAFRADFSYDLADSGLGGLITSVDAGYRFNNTSSTFDLVRSSIGLSRIADSPNGSLFSELLVPGPSNFGDGDGRTLAFRNFLLIDPDQAFDDPDGTLSILQGALASQPGMRTLNDPSSDTGSFFDIDETTHAAYGQVNFELGILRGNAGLRYLSTEIDSTGNSDVGGQVSQVVTSGGYDEWLPRVNLAINPTDNLQFRASWSEDIRRPDFQDLSTSIVFPTGPNNAVEIGNPDLQPETVTSFDVSAEWYFAPEAVFTVGFFHKERNRIFVSQLEEPLVDENDFRDITPPCEGGGIFNPIPDRNVFSDQLGNGLCVPLETIINDTASTTQTGVEFAFQYNLAGWEDRIGWASGFGMLANYTLQDFDGGEATNSSSARATEVFNAINGVFDNANFVPVTRVQGLLDLSRNAYNVTLFYEKFGISARARYTWRSSFRTLDTAGGASLNSTFGFPTVTAARGQLNAGINYDITDNFNVGVEAVNLTKSSIRQFCVNDDALLCFQGIPDRRITFGATYRF